MIMMIYDIMITYFLVNYDHRLVLNRNSTDWLIYYIWCQIYEINEYR